MNKIIIVIVKGLFLISIITGCNNDQWEYPFNGNNLDGWVQLNGKAKYEVVDGEIIGTTVANTPNSFLATEKMYTDFIFEVELLVQENMNSGIQFRSNSNPVYRNGRVHGYQCEVDPSDRRWSAGIYDEGRRGWLYPVELNPKATIAFKNGEWNKYRIECIGNSMRTWLNGIPVAHVIDDLTTEGFIALQVHGIGSDKEKLGQQIKWRNIRVKTKNLKPAPFEDIFVLNLLDNHLSEEEIKQGYKLLFDGVTTNGWIGFMQNKFPDKSWDIVDGALTVIQDGNEVDLITTEEFDAFDLKFDFKLTEGSSSGVQYYIDEQDELITLEYQILDDEYNVNEQNDISDTKLLASLNNLIAPKKINRLVKEHGEWNFARVVIFPDDRVEHWLNGRKLVTYELSNDAFKKLIKESKYPQLQYPETKEQSPILLRNNNSPIQFRNIKIKTLE